MIVVKTLTVKFFYLIHWRNAKKYVRNLSSRNRYRLLSFVILYCYEVAQE